MNIDNNVWIGLAHVSDNKNHALLNGAEEAYVNVLALAINKREFINKVKSSLLEIGFDFINIEDVELYTQRIKNFEVDEIIKNLEKRVRETKATQFSSFHTFNKGS